MPEETNQTIETTEQAAGATPNNMPAAVGTPAAEAEVEGRGGKSAILADLARERDQRQALQSQVDELKPLKEQMQKLAGIFGNKEADPGKDIVTTLQEEVAAMRRDNLVNDVARRHGITDDNDVDLLRAAPNGETMQRLAERLKASNTAPTSPAPDPSQGSAPLTPEAAADAEYKAFFPETSS